MSKSRTRPRTAAPARARRLPASTSHVVVQTPGVLFSFTPGWGGAPPAPFLTAARAVLLRRWARPPRVCVLGHGLGGLTRLLLDARPDAQIVGVDPDPWMIDRARSALEDLLGNEPESVSGLQRRNGHWAIMLEVVEMRRIPESTDVLSSYEVVLDDSGDVVGMTRRRRYRRSQVEEA